MIFFIIIDNTVYAGIGLISGIISGMVIISFSIVVYFKKFRGNGNPRGIKWVENPLHDTILDHNAEESFLLPSWLSERNDIIFDTSCIEVGEVLGIGNFGMAKKGVIKLGNAMYLFFFLPTPTYFFDIFSSFKQLCFII